MKRFCLLILLFVVLASPGLKAQSVKVDYDVKTDFKKFKTYAFLAPGDSVLNRYRKDKLYGGTIVYAVNLEMKSRGLVMDTLKPDAIIMFYTSVHEITTYSESATVSVGVGIGVPGYYHGYPGYHSAYYMGASVPVAGGEITATQEGEGALKYVMFDTHTGKLAWSGMLEKTFELTEDVEKIVLDATVKIFKKFPIKKVH
ncbi:MAG TPA: DUF4136 domain-containing protein [Chryseolinea sp.]|nr:DUF4136 domain-containing protein [Chryseolinea sp.]